MCAEIVVHIIHLRQLVSTVTIHATILSRNGGDVILCIILSLTMPCSVDIYFVSCPGSEFEAVFYRKIRPINIIDHLDNVMLLTWQLKTFYNAEGK